MSERPTPEEIIAQALQPRWGPTTSNERADRVVERLRRWGWLSDPSSLEADK